MDLQLVCFVFDGGDCVHVLSRGNGPLFVWEVYYRAVLNGLRINGWTREDLMLHVAVSSIRCVMLQMKAVKRQKERSVGLRHHLVHSWYSGSLFNPHYLSYQRAIDV